MDQKRWQFCASCSEGPDGGDEGPRSHQPSLWGRDLDEPSTSPSLLHPPGSPSLPVKMEGKKGFVLAMGMLHTPAATCGLLRAPWMTELQDKVLLTSGLQCRRLRGEQHQEPLPPQLSPPNKRLSPPQGREPSHHLCNLFPKEIPKEIPSYSVFSLFIHPPQQFRPKPSHLLHSSREHPLHYQLTAPSLSPCPGAQEAERASPKM